MVFFCKENESFDIELDSGSGVCLRTLPFNCFEYTNCSGGGSAFGSRDWVVDHI